MKFKYFPLLGLAALTFGITGCEDPALDTEKLALNNRTVAYTPVTEPITSRVLNASTLSIIDPGDASTISFDSHQAWFDFTSVSSANKGKASLREAWNLGFWNGAGLNRAILNYSVTTQASVINGETDLEFALFNTTELENAYGLINGGTFGMGDLSTFDFHSEDQFVIGTPSTTNRIYLVKTPPVQVHPDTTVGSPITVQYWLASLKWNSTASRYDLQYQGVQRLGTSNWEWVGGPFPGDFSPTTLNTLKNSNYQYSFVSFGEQSAATVQPQKNQWNLGLSAVTLKRYMSTGASFPWALKGVVLNNNTDVEVYRVQTTASTAGSPGPYDPNFSGSGSSDPALNPANSIESQFLAFDASDIDDTKFSNTTQEEIGQYWRYLDMGNYRIFVDRFYVIKLANGDVYKLKFDNLTTGSTSNPVNNGIKFRYTRIATP